MKKTMALLLTMLLTMGVAISPVSSHQNQSVNFDFEDYISTWDGADITKDGALPPSTAEQLAVGKWEPYQAMSDVKGLVSEKEGTNTVVKSVNRGISSDWSGLKYTFNSPWETSMQVDASIKIAGSTADTYTNRELDLRGPKSSDGSNTNVKFVQFHSSKKINIFGVYSGKNWDKDTWYDISCRYNIISGYYEVTIKKADGTVFVNQKGTDTTGFNNIIQVMFLECGSSSTNVQNTLIDNVSLKTINNLVPPDMYDFEDYTGGKPADQTNFTMDKMASTIDKFTSVSTDKGTSLRINSDVAYQGLKVIPKDTTHKTIEFKASLKRSDYAGSDGPREEIVIRPNNTSNNQIYPIQFNGSTLGAFGKTVATDIGQKTDIWYDLMFTFDVTTQAYTYSVSGDGKTWSGDGTFSYPTWDPSVYTNITQVQIRNARATGAFLVDDVSYKLLAYETNDFKMIYSTPETATAGVSIDTPVTLKFSKNINKTTCTAERFSVNYSKGQKITSDMISFPGDDTVAITGLTLEKGKHYNIAYTDIEDTDGTKTTGFIEFNTIYPAITGYGTKFIQKVDGNDSELSVLPESGDIYAKGTFCTNNGDNRHAAFILALYNGNSCVDVKLKAITVTPENNIFYSDPISIPNDGGNYKMRAFLWGMNYEPLLEMEEISE